MQYNINRMVSKIFALSLDKIDKHDYLTVEEIFPPQQQRTIEQVKVTYLLLGKSLEKTNTIDKHG